MISIAIKGALGDTFFVILEGQVANMLMRSDETEVVLNHWTTGKYFGEMTPRSRRRTTTARAVGDAPTQVIELDRTTLEQIIRNSNLAESNMYKLVGERLANLDQSSQDRVA